MLIGVLVLTGAWGQGDAQAHTRSVSYAAWSVDAGSASVRMQLSALDLNGLEATAARRGEAVTSLLQQPNAHHTHLKRCMGGSTQVVA